MLEMQISAPTKPLPPVVWNYEEVRSAVAGRLKDYQGRVYTTENIAAAKADRASLNKLSDAIAARRREVKEQYLEPYNEFDGQCKEIESMIRQASAAIDAQVKDYEQAQADRKRAEIEEMYRQCGGDLCEILPLSELWDKRWLNKTYRMGAIEEELKANFSRVRDGIKTIRETCGKDADACLDTYLHGGLDLPASIAKHHALEDLRKKQAERESTCDNSNRLSGLRKSLIGETEQPDVSPVMAPPSSDSTHSEAKPAQEKTIDFRVAYTSSEQLAGLRQYIITHGMRLSRVPKDN